MYYRVYFDDGRHMFSQYHDFDNEDDAESYRAFLSYECGIQSDLEVIDV